MVLVSGKSVLCLPVLTTRESHEVLSVCGELGPDPSSKDFVTRTKNIAFVLCIDDVWYQINRNYFNQSKSYNSLSGGYRRYYRELPRNFIENRTVQALLTRFKQIHDIPEGQLVLVHVQTSHIGPRDDCRCLTGHGIHTDGQEKAMILCLRRRNVVGALNSFYGDQHGEEVIVHPFVLKEGHACFWEDNQIFHHASGAACMDGVGTGERTVMVATYPAKFLLEGIDNPNNNLRRF